MSTLCIEGGGTRTYVNLANGSAVGIVGPTTSIDLMKQISPVNVLVPLIASALAQNSATPGDIGTVVVFHAAASTRSRAGEYLELVREALGLVGASARTFVTNDMVPLLFSSPAAQVVTIIAGTGTSSGARDATGRYARVGGGDFVLSDQGGGFDIGMAGLRSVVKALDRRGPATALTASAFTWAGAEPPARPRSSAPFIALAYDSIYGPAMRSRVAGFARVVIEHAATGDEVATAIVGDGARELLDSVHAAADQLAMPDAHVVLSGNLIGADSYMGVVFSALLDKSDRVVSCSRYEPSDAVKSVEPFLRAMDKPQGAERLESAFPLASGR